MIQVYHDITSSELFFFFCPLWEMSAWYDKKANPTQGCSLFDWHDVYVNCLVKYITSFKEDRLNIRYRVKYVHRCQSKFIYVIIPLQTGNIPYCVHVVTIMSLFCLVGVQKFVDTQKKYLGILLKSNPVGVCLGVFSWII